MARISEFGRSHNLKPSDLLIVDSADYGTRTMTVDEFTRYIFGQYDQYFAHKYLPRGANLGDSFTAAQQLAISSGNFTDLYVGDYWSIGGNKYYILDFDYWYYNSPTTEAVAGRDVRSKHHVVVACPISINTNFGSPLPTDWRTLDIFSTMLPAAGTAASTAFGAKTLAFYHKLPTSVSGNYYSGYTGVATYATIPNLIQIGQGNMIFNGWYGASTNNVMSALYQCGSYNGKPFAGWDYVYREMQDPLNNVTDLTVLCNSRSIGGARADGIPTLTSYGDLVGTTGVFQGTIVAIMAIGG